MLKTGRLESPKRLPRDAAVMEQIGTPRSTKPAKSSRPNSVGRQTLTPGADGFYITDEAKLKR